MSDASGLSLKYMSPEIPTEFRKDKAMYVILVGQSVANVDETYRLSWAVESDERKNVWVLQTPELNNPPEEHGNGLLAMTLQDVLTKYVVDFPGAQIPQDILTKQRTRWQAAQDFITQDGKLREPGDGTSIVYKVSPLEGTANSKGVPSLQRTIKDLCWVNDVMRGDYDPRNAPTDDDLVVRLYGFKLVYDEEQGGGALEPLSTDSPLLQDLVQDYVRGA